MDIESEPLKRSEERSNGRRLSDDYYLRDSLDSDNGLGGRSSAHFDSQHHSAPTKRYLYAGLALILALISFVVQTEAAGYLANKLEYRKPIFALYLTHSSWTLLWPLQFLFLKLFSKRHLPWQVFVHRHLQTVIRTAKQVASKASSSDSSMMTAASSSADGGGGTAVYYPNTSWRRYFITNCLWITLALNIAGASWYVAVNMTTPADVTAIYNCSAFFAYGFSVLILNERFSWYKAASVALSMTGVLAIAYGGGDGQADESAEATTTSTSARLALRMAAAAATSSSSSSSPTTSSSSVPVPSPVPLPLPPATVYPDRLVGNVIIGVGAVLYGLYEVLYKARLCPANEMQVSSRRQALFANVIGSVLGACTCLWLWPILIILHIFNIETFELPHGEAAWVLALSVLANMTFSGSFLVMMALTSPVLSSVAALVTTFVVAIVDRALFGTAISSGGMVGGFMIVVAFAMLSHATWKELGDEEEDEEI